MGTAFWIRHFITVLVLACVLITLAQSAKSHTFQDAMTQGVL
jgi:hypothetical protein